MSENTTNTTATQAPSSAKPWSPQLLRRVLQAAPHNPSVTALEAMEGGPLCQLLQLPVCATACPVQLCALYVDAAGCVVDELLPLPEYLEGVQTFGTLAEYLEEADWDNVLLAELDAEEAARLAPPTPAPELPPGPAAESVVQGQQEAQEKAAAEEAALQEAADAALRGCGKEYARGLKAYRAGLLAAGQLGHDYCLLRMRLDGTREVAVQAIGGELAKYARGKVDVNDLIAAYHSYALLAVPYMNGGSDAKDTKRRAAAVEAVPYTHYREHYRQLIQRADKDTVTERWVLLPGVEAEAVDVFTKSLAAGWSAEELSVHVKAVQKAYTDRLAEATAQRQEEQRKVAEAARQAEEAKQRELAAKWQQEQEAKRLADTAKGEQREQLTATATALEAERRQLAEEAKAAQLDREQQEREKAKRDREAADAKSRQDKAAEKTRKAQDKAAEKAVEATATKKATGAATPDVNHRPKSLLAQAGEIGEKGAPKDVAELAAELVTRTSNPDATAYQLLKLLGGHNCIGRTLKLAIAGCLAKYGQAVDASSPVKQLPPPVPAAEASSEAPAAEAAAVTAAA